MELGKQQYTSIIKMPIDRLHSYIKWKVKFDEEVSKMKEDQLKDIK
jgi:hypothetical protein